MVCITSFGSQAPDVVAVCGQSCAAELLTPADRWLVPRQPLRGLSFLEGAAVAKLGSFDPLSYCPWLLVVQRGGGRFLSELCG